MKLKDYRKLRGLTRRAAGEALGVNQITIWRWETGRSAPRPEQARVIIAWSAGAVTAADLLGAES